MHNVRDDANLTELTELGIGQPAGVTHVFYEPEIPAKADFKTTEFEIFQWAQNNRADSSTLRV